VNVLSTYVYKEVNHEKDGLGYWMRLMIRAIIENM